MNKRFAFAAAAMWLAGAPALAAGQHKSHEMNVAAPEGGAMRGKGITIESPWARASVGRNGAAYFTLVNNGKADVKLIGVTAPVAKRVELHTHKMEGDIMRMRPLKNIIVPAGTSVTLKPGGHHVMLMGLTRKLKEGEAFPLTVLFGNGVQRQISVEIGKIGAAGPMGGMNPMGDHGDHKMNH